MKFQKQDGKNALDQNVNGNEVKQVIYSPIAKNEDKRQQATIEVADSLIFHSWSNLFRISRCSPPDGTTLILFLLSLSPVSLLLSTTFIRLHREERRMETTECVIKLESVSCRSLIEKLRASKTFCLISFV